MNFYNFFTDTMLNATINVPINFDNFQVDPNLDLKSLFTNPVAFAPLKDAIFTTPLKMPSSLPPLKILLISTLMIGWTAFPFSHQPLPQNCLPCVTKPTPYSNSTHFSNHFAYHIAFPFVITWWSGSGQAHWTATMLFSTWLRAHSRDCQPHHMTVSLTSILTPWHTPTPSLVCHLYLSPFSLYYNSLPLPIIPTPCPTPLSNYLCHHSLYIHHSH